LGSPTGPLFVLHLQQQQLEEEDGAEAQAQYGQQHEHHARAAKRGKSSDQVYEIASLCGSLLNGPQVLTVFQPFFVSDNNFPSRSMDEQSVAGAGARRQRRQVANGGADNRSALLVDSFVLGTLIVLFVRCFVALANALSETAGFLAQPSQPGNRPAEWPEHVMFSALPFLLDQDVWYFPFVLCHSGLVVSLVFTFVLFPTAVTCPCLIRASSSSVCHRHTLPMWRDAWLEDCSLPFGSLRVRLCVPV
jgi:hypothetical protein